MSIKDIAQRTAVLRNLAASINSALANAETELKTALREQKKATGTTKISIELPDATPIGSVTLVQPPPAATVVDEAAWRDWVRSVMPGEIEPTFTVRVRPSTEKALLKSISAASSTVPQWCDPETGEVHNVPGVEVQPRAAYARMTLPADSNQAIAAAWQRGDLAHLVLPALTAGGES
ncbi:hypothetical protein [Yinghuangia soli]|uniref:Uncharacterized protein n=1 Tax=Yinghuangia soli TaxID=2908204 RepID=A0AA41U787_9ACTN|nr:hypothetical protein [Yinghuangia soli]MCF2531719.1 hypothetical protein [Yinghuangia soli]